MIKETYSLWYVIHYKMNTTGKGLIVGITLLVGVMLVAGVFSRDGGDRSVNVLDENLVMQFKDELTEEAVSRIG